jgi:hypothetical protein
MNLVEPPVQPDDDLDGLLRAFFRAEMPDPWPSLEAPPTLPAAFLHRPLVRSKVALAASVALLVTGSWLLPGSVPDDTVLEVPHGQGTAARETLGEVKTSLSLEQKKNEPTVIKVDVEVLRSK